MNRHIAVCILLGLCASVAQADLMQGLVAYYPMDGNADDASGNGNDGLSYGGITYGSGVQGNAAIFDGAGDHINAPNTTLGNWGTDASVAFWFSPDTGCFDGGQHRLLQKDLTSYWAFIITNTNDLGLYMKDTTAPGGSQVIPIVDELQPSAWVSIVMIKSGNDFDLYANGSLVFSDTTVIGDMVSSSPFAMGYSDYWAAQSTPQPQYFHGKMDEVRLYDRALTPEEAAEFAALPEPMSLSLLALGGLALLRRRR